MHAQVSRSREKPSGRKDLKANTQKVRLGRELTDQVRETNRHSGVPSEDSSFTRKIIASGYQARIRMLSQMNNDVYHRIQKDNRLSQGKLGRIP